MPQGNQKHNSVYLRRRSAVKEGQTNKKKQTQTVRCCWKTCLNWYNSHVCLLLRYKGWMHHITSFATKCIRLCTQLYMHEHSKESSSRLDSMYDDAVHLLYYYYYIAILMGWMMCCSWCALGSGSIPNCISHVIYTLKIKLLRNVKLQLLWVMFVIAATILSNYNYWK